MSSDESKTLKQRISVLESELDSKNKEVITYRQELLQISQRLDGLMSQISEDTKLLNKVQRLLVPTEIPNIAGFEISRKFAYGSKTGGDYFDIFEHEDKLRFGILLSSSSGYAMSALFLSLVMKLSYLLEAKKGTPPHIVMGQLADEIKKTSKSQDTTHAFYGVVDRRDFTLKFCSAGQIIGFYQSSDKTSDKKVQLLKSTCSALSSQFDEKLTMAEIEIQPKSRLCLMTQGITEVLSTDEIVRIMTDLSKQGVHELRNEIFFQAARKSKLEDPLRDQTVLVIEAKDRMIKLAK